MRAPGRVLLRASGQAMLGLAGLIGTYLLAAALGGVIPGPTADLPDDGPGTEIRLIAGPIHYDIVLPLTPRRVEDWAFAVEAGVPLDDPRAEWLIVGWGARDFYTTTGTMADVAPAAAWRAATGDASVLRVDALAELAGGVGRPLRLSAAQLAALEAAILAGFDGRAALEHPGLTGSDAFFPAVGRFHILRTCNSWIGRVLREAGVPMGFWTPTPYAVSLSLWRLDRGP